MIAIRLFDRPASAQKGAALLTVLTVLAVLGILVSLLFQNSRSGIRPWVQEGDDLQALYNAESGIAYQLYLERFSDSSDPSFSKRPPPDSLPEMGLRPPTDTFAFRLDTAQRIPEVLVDRTRAFLDITSIGRYRNAADTVVARFGKALDDSIFGPALTMDNSVPLEAYAPNQVRGYVRVKMPPSGLAVAPWPAGFSMTAYAAEFTDKRYYALEASLQKKLGDPGGKTGNGNFDPQHVLEFVDKDLVFTLGRVEITNNGNSPWIIKGPGRIFCEGEIRVKGLIRLENVQLLSGKDITFEDSVTGSGVSAYARGSIFLHDRCNLELEAVATKDILLRDRSQTGLGSVLLSVGGKGKQGAADTLNAIRVVNEATARGFLIAGGENGRVALATEANVVQGVVMAASVWLAGEVDGPVVTRKLLCEGTNQRNCLGTGRIDRSRLPAGFVQPLQLGPQDRRQYAFRLTSWRRT